MSLHVIYREEDKIHEDIRTPDLLNSDERRGIITSLGNKLKRGDIVAFADQIGYRNMGKSIYDGNDLVSLDYLSADDYGIVPKEFTIGDEFTLNHWMKEVSFVNDDGKLIYGGPLIDHNTYVWLDARKYRKEMIGNITLDEEAYSYFTYFDTKNGRVNVEINIDAKELFISHLFNEEPIIVEVEQRGENEYIASYTY